MTDKLEDGSPINLFEGGSILQYLAERYDTEHKISFPRGSREHFEMANWVYWQHGGMFRPRHRPSVAVASRFASMK